MTSSLREGLSSVSSSLSAKFADGRAKEFLWGCELTKEKPDVAWNFEEEDEDHEFLEHTLFLRHAVLGDCADTERHIIQVETKNFQGEEMKHPIACLCPGKTEMCSLDLNFSGEIPVVFRLVQGSGPVHLTAQQLVEFPNEDAEDLDTETECTATETEDLDTGDEEVTKGEVKGKKRKASNTNLKKKRGKVDAEEEEEEDEEEDDEDADEEEEEEDMEAEEESDDEEEESEDEEVEKKKKGKMKPKEKKDLKKKDGKAKVKSGKGKKGKK